MYNRCTKILLTIVLTSSLVISAPFMSLAHSGRTDSSGGHKDNKNASGLGYYHYHHGMGPHLHPNGICPYNSQSSTTTKSTTAKTVVKKSSDSTATIKAAQQKLTDLGYYTGKVDGNFGSKSKAALKAFQEDNGLEVDGKLGPKSKAALGIK